MNKVNWEIIAKMYRTALLDILEVNGDGSTEGGNSDRSSTGGSGHAKCREIAINILESRYIAGDKSQKK